MHLSCFWQHHISAHVELLDGDGDMNTATFQRFDTSGLFYSRGQVLKTATLQLYPRSSKHNTTVSWPNKSNLPSC